MEAENPPHHTDSFQTLLGKWLVAVLLVFGCSTQAIAGGVWLYEIGTPDLGVAAAGRGATALDASVAITNPAAMTNLNRSELLFGIQGIFIDTQFSAQENTFSGGNGGNAGGVLPAGSFSYVGRLEENLWFGFGTGSYFGLGLNYDDDWSGRYYVQEASLFTAGATVSLGTKLTEKLSAGFGVDMLVAKLFMKSAVNNPPLAESNNDGQLKVDATTVGVGCNAGLFYTITPKMRTGLTYRSPVQVKFNDAVSVSGLEPALTALLTQSGLLGSDIDLKFTIPQAVGFSLHYDITPLWAVMGTVSWQNWRQFGELEVSISNTAISDATVNLDYDDTWHVAVGIQGRIADDWIWSVGAAYDTSPCSESNRSPVLPLDRQIRLATGLQYEWGEDITLGIAYQYLDAGKGKIDRKGGPLTGRLKGEYGTNHLQYLALNIQWKF